MKRTWTIIGVHDVPRSFQWYQSLFGQASTAPAHSDFGSSTLTELCCSAFTNGPSRTIRR